MPKDGLRETHDKLMSRMAKAVGTDLDAAEARGAIDADARDEMLTRCTGCTSPGDCAKWLDENRVAEAAPDYCRNGLVLLALREGG